MLCIRHRQIKTHKDEISININNIKYASSMYAVKKNAKMHSNVNDSDNSVDIEDMYKSQRSEQNIDHNTGTTRDDNQQSKDDDDQNEGELKPYNNTKTIKNVTAHEGDV